MAQTNVNFFPSSQWSIDFQSACLEAKSEARYAKLDLAVQACFVALRAIEGSEEDFAQRSAIRLALSDLIVLRSITSNYEQQKNWCLPSLPSSSGAGQTRQT